MTSGTSRATQWPGRHVAGHRRSLHGVLTPATAGAGAEARLAEGRAHERAGALDAALDAYADAARLAAGTGEPALRTDKGGVER